MIALIAIWALAEATLFFIVADVPIMALGIKAGWRKALVGAGVAGVFAAIGGSILFYLSLSGWKDMWEVMLLVPGIDRDLTHEVIGQWNDSGVWAMMVGSFTGTPYKLYAWAAAGDWPIWWLPIFFLASILARLPRFALVALVAGWLGPKLVERFGARTVWIAFGLCWTGFYLWYWSVMGF